MLRPTLTDLRAGTRRAVSFLSMVLLLTACNEEHIPVAPEDPITPSPSVTTVVGTVTSSTSGDPVAGAQVRIGAATVTTGADGRYELTVLAAGPVTLRCIAPGFEPFAASVTVPSEGLEEDIPLTPGPLHIVGGVDDLAQVFIKVDRMGHAVTDAVVTVNGTGITHTGRGAYEGTIPRPIAAQAPVLLQVSAGGVTVEATGNVPEAPVLTAPMTGSAFQFPDTLSLTWTSPTDPDLFTGSMGQTPGAAREARIAARKIACDTSCDGLINAVTKSISISAVRRLVGTRDFAGPAHVTSSFTIESAGSPAVITIRPASLSLPLHVTADLGSHGLVGPWAASVSVSDRSFHEVPEAVVAVNGLAMPRICPFGCVYGGPLPDPLVGSSLVLDVEVAGARVTGTSTRPETPVLDAPAAGAAFTVTDSITVRWASQTDPAGFVLQASWNGGAAGSAFVDLGTVSGTSRERKIAASTLAAHASGVWRISVQALNEGSLTGPVTSESYMHVRSGKAEISIAISQ